MTNDFYLRYHIVLCIVIFQVIVMAPTRELAKQVGEDFSSISDDLSILCVYGGTPYYPQGTVHHYYPPLLFFLHHTIDHLCLNRYNTINCINYNFTEYVHRRLGRIHVVSIYLLFKL